MLIIIIKTTLSNQSTNHSSTRSAANSGAATGLSRKADVFMGVQKNVDQMFSDEPNSRFHGCDIFREIGFLP